MSRPYCRSSIPNVLNSLAYVARELDPQKWAVVPPSWAHITLASDWDILTARAQPWQVPYVKLEDVEATSYGIRLRVNATPLRDLAAAIGLPSRITYGMMVAWRAVATSR